MAESNDAHLKFLQALKDMRKALPLVGKGTDGYNYKYAALEDILQEWEPVFDEHGFVLRQSTTAGDSGLFDMITSKLTHVETGISEVASLTLPVGDDWQKAGAGITYFKRYTLTALGKQPVGEDFDGLKTKKELDRQGGTGKEKASGKKKSTRKKANGAAPEEEAGVHVAIKEFIKDCKDMTSLMEYYRANEGELNKLKENHPDIHVQCMSEFTKRREELQDA
jgi:hypothetical protein